MNKLLETTTHYPMTEIWNDSCSVEELKYCINNGGVGATTNPVIVLNVLKKELPQWENQIQTIIKENPHATEDEVAWSIIKLLGKTASTELLPIFNKTNGKQGRISFQTNAKFYRNKELMLAHAIELAGTVVNSQIKAPTSQAGVEAFEEMTYQGISINATVSFTVAQAIAVAEAVENGLNRRIKEGLPVDTINPVCTIMAGRVDDYLKKDCKEKGLLIEPEILEWAGVAVVKNAYQIYQEKGYHTSLLVAAYRNPYHWNQFIGGKIILTIPYDWQLKYNSSGFEITSTMENSINEEYLKKLLQLEEFNKAYLPNGLTPEEFEHYGAFIDTMNQFLNGYDELCKLIRKYMVV